MMERYLKTGSALWSVVLVGICDGWGVKVFLLLNEMESHFKLLLIQDCDVVE